MYGAADSLGDSFRSHLPLASDPTERLATLARVLGVSADYLLGLQDTAAPLGAPPPPVPERNVRAGG
jgi:hypothetical protein